MKKLIITLFSMLIFQSLLASEHQRIYSLGSSAKGQYVALEENGYRAESRTYYVIIRFIDVWSGQDIGEVISIETPATGPELLIKARLEAKELARNQINKLKIISI